MDIELKKEFQLERIIFFSDAVFAIAITLLIIDIRIPYHENFTEKQLLVAIAEEIPSMIGFLISFFFIGGYWIIHHRMFGYVYRFDIRLIWLNLFFLLSIVILPFSTSVFGMYAQLKTGMCLYLVNGIFTGIMNWLCWKHVLNPAKKLTAVPFDKSFRNAAYFRALIMPAWFLICCVAVLITKPEVGGYMLPGVAIIHLINRRIVKRKKNKEKK